MAASTVIKQFTDGTVLLRDGTGTPVTFTIPFTVGDMAINDLKATQRETTQYQSRGVPTSARHTNALFPSGSFTLHVADYSDATQETAYDFLRFTGSFSSNVSTLGANAEVNTIDIVWTVAGVALGDAANHVCTITDAECTINLGEGEPNTITVNFVCREGGGVSFS